MKPYALQPGQGWIYRAGIDFNVKASELPLGSGAAVLEYTTSKGEEPGDHVHPTEDEMFYVLEGSLRFNCGDQLFDVNEGGFVFLPRGITHGYTIQSDGKVRLLVITTPPREAAAGWDGFVGGLEASGDVVSRPEGE